MRLRPYQLLLLAVAGYAIYRATRPTITPVAGYIGDLADAASDKAVLTAPSNITSATEQQGQTLTDSVKAELMKAAIAQSGISLAIVTYLQFVCPPWGNIAGAVIAVIQAAGSAYEKRKIQEITDNLRDRLTALINDYNGKEKALWDKAIAEEVPTVKAILTGHDVAPLAGEGLGSGKYGIFGAGTTMDRIVTPVAHAIAQATVIPIQLTIAASLKLGKGIANIVGAEGAVKSIDKLEDQNRALANKGMERVETAITQPDVAISQAGKVLRTITGEQAVFDARDTCNKIYADVSAKAAADFATFQANVNDPKFRQAMRDWMIAHPDSTDLLQDVVNQLNAASNLKIMLGAGLAAAAGLFMFKR